MTQSVPPARPAPNLKILWTRLALFVSVVGVVGSLYLSLGMELKACSLCFYQRAFIMSVAAILALGLYMPGIPAAVLTPLALAPAAAGGWIAVVHVYLDATGVLECPIGVTGFLVAPQESLVVYLLLMIFLLIDLFHQNRYVMRGIGAILIGYVLASTSMKATPPGREPTAPYQTPKIDECRKIYREKR
jgi:disulfide bond formation protein DsbB